MQRSEAVERFELGAEIVRDTFYCSYRLFVMRQYGRERGREG